MKSCAPLIWRAARCWLGKLGQSVPVKIAVGRSILWMMASRQSLWARAITLDGDRVGKGALRPPEQRGEHLPHLIAIVVDRLLAGDDQAGGLLVGNRLDQLGHRQRLDLIIALHQNGAIRAHRQRRAQRLGGLGRPNRHRHDLDHHAVLLQANGLLDRDLVERVHLRHWHGGRPPYLAEYSGKPRSQSP